MRTARRSFRGRRGMHDNSRRSGVARGRDSRVMGQRQADAAAQQRRQKQPQIEREPHD
jgi:hypothetical protein